MTAGSAVLMWIGEQITEKGVGNGISIVLTINIVSGMPSDIANLFTNFVAKDGISPGMRGLFSFDYYRSSCGNYRSCSNPSGGNTKNCSADVTKSTGKKTGWRTAVKHTS